MLSSGTRRQLIAFVVVTIIGVSYAAVTYLQVPRMLGIGTYSVTLDLPRTGGLYENALVMYRGTEVGKVEAIELGDGNVRAVLAIEDARAIPADSAVSIRSMSAIGEQYVNFEPRSASAAIEDGTVIPADRVSLPTPTGELLSSVTRLASTLPLDKLNRTVDEAYAAFGGAGPHVATFLRAAARLQSAADANLEPTLKLFRDLHPVLATQQDVGAEVRSFSGDLAAATGTLRAADASIRGTIDKAPAVVDELDSLLKDLSPTLPQLLTDLTSTGQVLRVYVPSMRHVLVVFPAAVASLTSTTAKGVLESGENPPTMSAMGFKLTFNNPPPCLKGFDPDRIPPSDLSNSTPPPTDAYCKEPKDSPIGVRGFRNAPCPEGSPTGPGSTGATAAACGWHFQSPREAKRATDEAIKHMLEVAARNPKTRAENEAFIGDDDFSSAEPGPPPPYINGPGNLSNQDEDLPQHQSGTAQQSPDGSFVVGGSRLLSGGALPLPDVSTSDGPVSGAAQFLLAPLLTPA